ncbi:hypothetical protein INT45_008087 [Circinella minor]|uniref:SHSP domain-containing protein n=1 Tax=Circinella minor TaxID=1195481 RepID=A0A8H7RTQ5_9FUNG|nr:hypothetical protein INT45_008087 [Circinella minor]
MRLPAPMSRYHPKITKLLTVIANQQSKNAINDDNRSPLLMEEQDDSVEYNQDFIEKLKEELDKEAADKRQKHTTQYQEAVEALSLADEEGTILTTKLSEIFNNSNIDEQLQNSDKYEPSYNMYKDESFVYVYVDLPGMDIKQIKITGSSSGILSISGTRKNMNVPGSCLLQDLFQISKETS